MYYGIGIAIMASFAAYIYRERARSYWEMLVTTAAETARSEGGVIFENFPVASTRGYVQVAKGGGVQTVFYSTDRERRQIEYQYFGTKIPTRFESFDIRLMPQINNLFDEDDVDRL